MINRLVEFLKIKSGEGRLVLLLGGAIFATNAGYWLGSNAVDALLFSRYPNALPYVLMLKGAIAFVVITLYSFWAERLNKQLLLTISTSIVLLVLIGGRIALLVHPPSTFYLVLWPLTYAIPDLLEVQIWALAVGAFDSRQSKRLFPLLNAGGTIGIVLGNFLTAPAAKLLHTENLLFIWAGLAIFGYLTMRFSHKGQESPKPKLNRTVRLEDKLNFWQSLNVGATLLRYYAIIGWLALSTLLVYLLYYLLWQSYIKVSTQNFPNNPDELAGFLGLVAGGAVIVAFLLSLLVVNRLFSRFGIRNMLLVMPITNLLCFGLILISNVGFGAVVVARFIQLTIRTGIHDAADPTIYNLIPGEVRETARAFIQGFCKQAGIVLAGLLLLVGVPLGSTPLLVMGLLLSLFYLYVAWRERILYRASLVQLLKQGQQEFFDQQVEENAVFGVNVGEDALHVAIGGMRDLAEGTRRLSAELLGKLGAPEGVPPLLKALISDRSSEVRRTAIVALTQLHHPEVFSNIAEAINDSDSGVRAAAVVGLRYFDDALDPLSYKYLQQALQDTNPNVRKEAVLTLAARGKGSEALVVLWEMGHDSDSNVRKEAAAGYGALGEPVLTNEVINLLYDNDPQVRKTAAASLGRIGSNQAITVLITRLEDNNEAVREQVAEALALLQPHSFVPLHRYLASSHNDIGQLAALRSLYLARLRQLRAASSGNKPTFETTVNTAGEDLLQEFELELAEMPIQTQALATAVESQVERSLLLAYGQRQIRIAVRVARYLEALHSLAASLKKTYWADSRLERYVDLDAETRHKLQLRPYRNPQNLDLLLKSLQERYNSVIKRLVMVVGLVSDAETIALVSSTLNRKTSSRVRADAIETLENVGDRELTPALVMLLEGRIPDWVAEPLPGKTLVQLLQRIWEEYDEWLQACVLHAVGLFDLSKMRPLVEHTLLNPNRSEDSLLENAAMEAQQRLDWPRDDLELERSLTLNMQTLGTLSIMSRILFLQKAGIFANLSPEDLRRMARVSKERIFAPGEIICYEGDTGDELYIVVSGRVQVIAGYGGPNLSETPGGSGRTLAIRGEGEVLGEIAILDDTPRSATLRAYSGPVRLLTLHADEFKRIMHERPELAIEVIRTLTRWLRETNHRIESGADITLSEHP
jgi:HEAT repeat protein/CRP-like cAMP-binding protein